VLVVVFWVLICSVLSGNLRCVASARTLKTGAARGRPFCGISV
jgi:hypothetical protein